MNDLTPSQNRVIDDVKASFFDRDPEIHSKSRDQEGEGVIRAEIRVNSLDSTEVAHIRVGEFQYLDDDDIYVKSSRYFKIIGTRNGVKYKITVRTRGQLQ